MDVLKPLIEQLTRMIKDGYDLGKNQLPDIAKEILRYSIWSEFLTMIETFSFFSLAIFFIHKLWLKINDSHENDGYWVAVITLAIIGGLSFIWALWSLDTLLKIKMAPKMYLLEEIASILNQKSCK